MNSFESIE